MKENRFMKQHDVKWLRWLGTFMIALFLTSPVLGTMVSLMECGTFYGVQKNNIHKLIPWMSFPVFLIVALLFGLFVIYIFYTIVYPVYQAAVNRQAYIHRNPVEKDLTKLKIDNELIKRKLGINASTEEIALIKEQLGIKDDDN